METYKVVIEGTTPLLQSKFTDADAVGDPGLRKGTAPKLLPREQAEKLANRRDDGRYCMSGWAFLRLLREAGANVTVKGSKRKLKFLVPSCVRILEEMVDILRPDMKPWTTFEVDSRSVVNPFTKGRMMRHRPRWDAWRVVVTIEIDETDISSQQVHALLEEGGRKLGVGDFRPEKGGPFGRFAIVEFSKAA